MSNLPYHRPPEFELFRNESVSSQNRKKALVAAQEAARQNGAGCRDGGLWWAEQRKVNQVAPAEMVNPDNFDTVKYRYQVFARPPPERCELCEIDHQPPVSDEVPPIRYNVRRVAIDKEFCPPRPCSSGAAGGPTSRRDLNITNNAIDTVRTSIVSGGGVQNDCKYLNQNNNNDDCALSHSNNNEEKWSRMATCGSGKSTPDSYSSTPVRFSPGYGTYQIIGGRQYHQPPPNLYDADTKVPPAQDEYRAFQRRCPNFKIGRYDHSQALNENMSAANKSSILLKTSLSPFRFLKNPHRNKKMVNLFAPEITDDLTWPVPSKL